MKRNASSTYSFPTHLIGVWVLSLAVMLLSACSPPASSISEDNSNPTNLPSVISQSIPDVSVPYSKTVELTDDFQIEFIADTATADFSSLNNNAETLHPGSIALHGEDIYFLSYDGDNFALNKYNLSSKDTSVLYQSDTEKIDSFLIVDETEILLMLEREPELGTPHYKTETICYDAETGTSINFAERFDLGSIPYGGISSIAYSDGYYFFDREVTIDETVRTVLTRCNVATNQAAELRPNALSRALVGSIVVYINQGVQVQFVGSDEPTPIIATHGGGIEFGAENVFFTGSLMHITDINPDLGDATIYIIDTIKQELLKTVTLDRTENPYDNSASSYIYPFGTGYMFQYGYPEDVTDFTYRNTLVLTFFDESGSVLAEYPAIDPFPPSGWHSAFFVIDHDIVYYLEGIRDGSNLLVSLNLKSISQD